MQKAEGVPLFVEEVTKTLLDLGFITRETAINFEQLRSTLRSEQGACPGNHIILRKISDPQKRPLGG
jgi:hypothetical protein